MIKYLLTLSVLLAFPALAQVTVRHSEALQEVPAASTSPNVIDPQIIRGRPASRADWPATFISRYQISGGTYFCTTTLIGPRVALTAGHCIGDQDRISVEIITGTRTYVCTPPRGFPLPTSPGYPNPQSADWALCALEGLADVTGIRFERIYTEPNTVVRGRVVIVLGYGCQVVGGPYLQTLWEGQSTIALAKTQVTGHPYWAATVAGATTGQSSVCEGDSGGATYIVASSGRRYVVAVNSARDPDKQGISYLSTLSSQAALAYIQKWVELHPQLIICGRDNNAIICA